jgi:hypothetical protein
MVEHRLPKPVVAGSIPVSRSTIFEIFFGTERLLSVLFKSRENEPRK